MQLDTNAGTADRVMRIVLGLALLSAIVLLSGRERWLGLLGFVPLWTAEARFCLLHTVLGIHTCVVTMT